MQHELKTHPEPFDAVFHGYKRFEYRYCGDRTFSVGDTLLLQEYIPETATYTGRTLEVQVIYLLSGEQFGVPKDYCVMSIVVLDYSKAVKPMTEQERKEFSAEMFKAVINTLRPGTYPDK